MKLYGLWRFERYPADFVPHGFWRDESIPRSLAEGVNPQLAGLERWHVIETTFCGAARAIFAAAWSCGLAAACCDPPQRERPLWMRLIDRAARR